MSVLNVGIFSWQPGQHAAQSGQKCVQSEFQWSESAADPAGESFGGPQHKSGPGKHLCTNCQQPDGRFTWAAVKRLQKVQ